MRSYFIIKHMEKSLADKGNERKMREYMWSKPRKGARGRKP